MDIVFADPTAKHDTTGLWSAYYDRPQLVTVLQRATSTASKLGQAVLVSYIQPIAASDPLHVFASLQSLALGASFFWTLPDERRALVGAGTATTLETVGETRFASAATLWRTLQQHAVVYYGPGTQPALSAGPLLFGGFAFDPSQPHTSLWHGFPDGLLMLPRLCLSFSPEGNILTLNQLLQAPCDIEQCADELISTALRLHMSIEHTRGAQQEQQKVYTELALQDLLPAEKWKEFVASTVQKIRYGDYQKVVLARGVQVTGTTAFDVIETLHRLSQTYPGAYTFAIQRGERYFVGATPERLASAQGRQIRTMALAGSAPRGSSEEEDHRLGLELLQSAKNKDEHQIVVETLRTALAALCSKVWVSDKPQLLRLQNIQHLETPIVGELLTGYSLLEALQALHPTPAVGGFPRDEALAEIRNNERLDRGWYAGPVGWIDTHGNGEFAVALRSGLIDGNRATLFAGCGIVADSNPESEYAESCLKLNVMLRGLGGNL